MANRRVVDCQRKGDSEACLRFHTRHDETLACRSPIATSLSHRQVPVFFFIALHRRLKIRLPNGAASTVALGQNLDMLMHAGRRVRMQCHFENEFRKSNIHVASFILVLVKASMFFQRCESDHPELAFPNEILIFVEIQ